MARICTGLVWVRSTCGGRSSPGARCMKKVSCSCRAGCSGAMFSASKLYQSVSTCGPSATAKPISAKIAFTSSMTWLTGWMVPCGRGRPGSVTSSHSPASRASSAASSSDALRARRAVSISSRRAFSALPVVWRSSGLILPSSRIFRLISPFLPSAARRTSSMVAGSAASLMRSSHCWRRGVRSSIVMPSGAVSAPDLALWRAFGKAVKKGAIAPFPVCRQFQMSRFTPGAMSGCSEMWKRGSCPALRCRI